MLRLTSATWKRTTLLKSLGVCNRDGRLIELTPEHAKDIPHAVLKFLLRRLLLLGVVLGLSGQGVAFASTPCPAMIQQQGTAMAGMPDCMAGQAKSGKQSAPCKEMTPGCMDMMGCASLVALDTPYSVVGKPLIVAATASWPATPILSGRSIAPDPDPPSILG